MVNSNQVTTQIITPIPNTTPSTTEWSTKLYDTEIFGVSGMCVYVSKYLAESWIFFRVSDIRICENDNILLIIFPTHFLINMKIFMLLS